jgi:CelD/BcsL family acetyltransferase involved in cellulose biosynthesis
LAEEIIAKVEVGGEDVIRTFSDRWERLCEEVQSPPYCRPEWIAAYIRAFEPRSEVVLVTASAGECLVGILPLIRRKCFYAGVPLTKLAGPANSHSIEFDILRAAGKEGDAAIRAMWNLLKRTPGWQMLELPLFPLSGTCPSLLSLAEEDGYPMLKVLVQNSPVLRLPGNGNGGPAQPVGSRHFRHELRRFARILAEETGTEPKVMRWEEPDLTLLEEFFRLEESGWKGKNGSAINCRPETRAFYHEIAREASQRGYFCLHSLDAKGQMVAGAFSMTTRDGFYPMKVAYDENLRRGGPGHVLFNAIVTECSEKHIPELFFGGTDEHYKSLWTQEAVPLYSAFVFSSDIRSLLAYRVRNHVLSPLGKLRWMVRQRLQKKHGPSKRRAEKPEAKTDTAKLVKVPAAKPAKERRPTVHSS